MAVKNPDEAKIRIGKLTRDFQSFTVDKKTAALRKFVQIESDSGAQLLPNELHLLYRLVGSPIRKLLSSYLPPSMSASLTSNSSWRAERVFEDGFRSCF